MLPQKNYFKIFFEKLLHKKYILKTSFKNCSLKKKLFFFKIAPSKYVSKKFFKKLHFKNSFKNIIPSKYSFQKTFLKNCSFKNYLFKIAPSKITFQNIFLKGCTLKKYISKNFFKKVAPQNWTCKAWKSNISYIYYDLFYFLREKILNISKKGKSFLYFSL